MKDHMLILVAVLTFSFAAKVLSAPTKKDVDEYFERRAAKSTEQIKAQTAQYGNQENEALGVEYYPRETELHINIRTKVLEIRGTNSFTKDDIYEAKAKLKKTACNGDLAPFMRSFGLRVIHNYYDSRSNDQVMKIVITKRDC